MTTLGSLTDMSVVSSNSTNGAITPYLVTFVSPISLINGDQVQITFNSNIKPITTNGGSSGAVACTGS